MLQPHYSVQLLFSAGDLVAAVMIIRLLRKLRAPDSAVLASAAAWLCNPYTAAISTRGSCDVLSTLLLLAMLLLIVDGRRAATLLASLLYGLVVHLRIYPIIYAPSIVLFLTARATAAIDGVKGSGSGMEPESLKKGPVNAADKDDPQGTARRTVGSSSRGKGGFVSIAVWQALSFGVPSALVFLLLGVGSYQLYGQKFLEEAFLHHLSRRDPRHNFSPHFYPIYLADYGPWYKSKITQKVESTGVGREEPPAAGWGSTPPPDVAPWASAAQLLLQVVLIGRLHRDLPGCMLIQTMAFVSLNKVR